MHQTGDTPARLALRDATREVHERLHHLPDFAALAAGRLNRAEYTRLLARLYGFHAPVEQAVAVALPQDGPDATAWRRAGLLHADLVQMGLDPAAIPLLPQAAPPNILTPAAALGWLYVIEGSTLGGRLLARGLDGILLGPQGRTFLSASLQLGHVRWAAVGAAIDHYGHDEAKRGQMVAGAVTAFQSFETWFAPPPP